MPLLLRHTVIRNSCKYQHDGLLRSIAGRRDFPAPAIRKIDEATPWDIPQIKDWYSVVTKLHWTASKSVYLAGPYKYSIELRRAYSPTRHKGPVTPQQIKRAAQAFAEFRNRRDTALESLLARRLKGEV